MSWNGFESVAVPGRQGLVMLAALLLLVLGANETPSKKSELSLLQLVARLPTPAEYLQLKHEPAHDPRRQPVLEFESRMDRGERLGFEEWKCLLLDRHWLRWRERWPREEPFALGMPQPPFCQQRLRLVPRVPDWKSAWSLRAQGCEYPMHQDWAADYQVLGMLPLAENTIVFDMVPCSSSRDRAALGNSLGTIELHIRAMGSAEECLTPLSDAERSAEIERQLAEYLYCRPRGSAVPSSQYELALFDWFQPPANIAVGFEAVLLHEGTPERRSWMVVRHDRLPYFWEDGGSLTANFIHRMFDELTEVEQRELGRETERPFDHVRVPGNKLVLRGSALRALRDWEASSYWTGTVEVSLADMIARQAHPRERSTVRVGR